VWRLKPVIDNDYWSGNKTNLKIAPGQSLSYEIAYTPLTTTPDKQEHKGSIFFALPDGTGLLYQLVGQATAPQPAAVIQRNIPCKTPYTHLLPVKNWLKTPQRFKVTIEADTDPSTSIKGVDYIDVPGLGQRQYKLNFYSYKETTTAIKVIFLNEETKEYLYFHLTFTTTPPEVLNTIELETPIRRPITHNLHLENPLDTAATFNISCDCDDVTVPSPYTLAAGTEGHVEVTFLPLLVKEVSARLTINSPQLGMYIYDLKLKSTAAGNEKPLYFKVGLGSKQTQTFRFINYAKSRTEYQCRVDSPDFMVDKSFNAPSAPASGSEILVDVTYEPSKLGDVRATLTITSEQGGEYICALFGHCVTPQPQGPILVKGGSPVSIPIFNPFLKQTTFQLSGLIPSCVSY
jgi:hypothetical protein